MKNRVIETFGAKVSDDDVIKFLGQFGSQTCPTCGTKDWDLTLGSPDEESQVLSLRAYSAAGMAGTSHVPVFIVVCQKCGYVNMYSTFQVAAWKRGQEGQSDE